MIIKSTNFHCRWETKGKISQEGSELYFLSIWVYNWPLSKFNNPHNGIQASILNKSKVSLLLNLKIISHDKVLLNCHQKQFHVLKFWSQYTPDKNHQKHQKLFENICGNWLWNKKMLGHVQSNSFGEQDLRYFLQNILMWWNTRLICAVIRTACPQIFIAGGPDKFFDSIHRHIGLNFGWRNKFCGHQLLIFLSAGAYFTYFNGFELSTSHHMQVHTHKETHNGSYLS